ncbi:MAG: low molecular weight phosphotyrosine protein phosphatase [Cyclobacteriaceae bacterium]|nr:low molecular weight phosphotyrosine protein phosphatase [Cyclobacteriaceae bacterium]
MIRVLFVCLGNICRSPLAEGIFQRLIEHNNLMDSILCDSCGTSNYHIGGQPDPRTKENAILNGVPLNHKARQFTVDDFNDFDYIIPMDSDNYNDIMSFPEAKFSNSVIKLMRAYDSEGKGEDVPDPYFGGSQGFQNVYTILDRSCNVLLQELIS